MTPLDKPIKRELQLGEQVYTVTISALGVRIVPKGRRLGQLVSWRDLLDGAPQLEAQLRHSLARADKPGGGDASSDENAPRSRQRRR